MDPRSSLARLFDSLPLLIVLILGGTSYSLAQRGEYEASMGALGTAVAVATARGNSSQSSQRERELTEENEELRSETEKLKVQIAKAEQSLEYQDIIRKIEIEKVELQAENRFLSAQQKTNLLPESQLETFYVEARETQESESLTKPGDENNDEP